MINSLELYMEALTFARNNPTEAAVNTLKNYYLQLVTMTFYELTAKRTSPLMSLFCQMNIGDAESKNFKITPQPPLNLPTNFDMYLVIDGLNYAFSDSLDSSLKICEMYKKTIFRGALLQENYFQELIKNLQKLDDNIGKLFSAERVVEKIVKVPVEKIIEKRVEVPVEKIVEKIVEVPAAQEKDFYQSLSELAKGRQADDEKILTEVKNIQRNLQGTLKTILELRDGIEFKTLQEPINQLIQLFDKIFETLQSHPKEDTQKGYENLLKRCRNFSRFVEQSLGMLGAELIKETNVPLDFNKHQVINDVRPSDSSKVSKVLRVGLIYKGQVLRKAEVEIAEPMMNQYAAMRKNFGR